MGRGGRRERRGEREEGGVRGGGRERRGEKREKERGEERERGGRRERRGGGRECHMRNISNTSRGQGYDSTH